MAPKNKGRKQRGTTVSVPQTFVVNLVANGDKNISLADLGFAGSWQVKPDKAWFSAATVNDDNNYIPVVQLSLLDGARRVAITPPTLVTNIPRKTWLSAPRSTDWNDLSSENIVGKLTISNINTSQAVLVTVTGKIWLHMKPPAAPRVVSII